MKFPIAVEHIEDRIVLFQGQITEDFLLSLREVNRIGIAYGIDAVHLPDLCATIYINGIDCSKNYKIKTHTYTKERFDKYQQIIETYKRAMGYE